MHRIAGSNPPMRYFSSETFGGFRIIAYLCRRDNLYESSKLVIYNEFDKVQIFKRGHCCSEAVNSKEKRVGCSC